MIFKCIRFRYIASASVIIVFKRAQDVPQNGLVQKKIQGSLKMYLQFKELQLPDPSFFPEWI